MLKNLHMSNKSSTFALEIGKVLYSLRPAKHMSNAGVRLKRIAGRKTHSEGARSKRGVTISDFGSPLFCITTHMVPTYILFYRLILELLKHLARWMASFVNKT